MARWFLSKKDYIVGSISGYVSRSLLIEREGEPIAFISYNALKSANVLNSLVIKEQYYMIFTRFPSR